MIAIRIILLFIFIATAYVAIKMLYKSRFFDDLFNFSKEVDSSDYFEKKKEADTYMKTARKLADKRIKQAQQRFDEVFETEPEKEKNNDQ
jgi:hypothetical protein